MPVSVVGAFSVIDRASRPIRKIRDEAIKADVAVAKLGESLDRVGTRQQKTGLNNVSTNMRKIAKEGGTAQTAARGLNRELDKTAGSKNAQGLTRTARAMDNTARSTENADRAIKRLDRDAGNGEKTVKKMAGSMMSAGVAMKAALVPAIGLAAQGIGALSVGVAGLLPNLTSFGALLAPMGAGMVGVGVAMVTVKLASMGLGKALSGNQKALKALTPQAREFVRTLQQYKPLLKGLQQAAQGGLLPGLDLALRRVVAAAPVVRQVLRSMGGTLGGIASQAASYVTRRNFLTDFQELAGQGGTLLQRGASILLNLGDALRHVFVAAMPFTDWLSKTVVGWSENIKQAALMGRETGRLAQWFRTARTDLEQFGRIGKNVWDVMTATFRDLTPTSNRLWGSIERITARWSDWARSTTGQGDMRKYIADMAVPLHQIVGLAADLGKGIGQLSRGQGFTTAIRSLREAIPSLTQGLNAMASGLGPAVVSALSSVVQLFATLATNGGALTTVVRLVGGLANSFNWLFQHVPALGTIIATALSVGALMRFGEVLGGLAGKWRAVGSAAATAGAQQAAATDGTGGTGIVGGAGRGAVVAAGGSRFSRVRGRLSGQPALLIGSTVATIGGQAIGGQAGNVLSGAGTGAAIGGTIGSVIPGVGTAVGAGVGAAGGALIALLSSRSTAKKTAAGQGQDAALRLLAGAPTTRQLRGRVTSLQNRLSDSQAVVSAGGPTYTIPGVPYAQGRQTQGARYTVTGAARKRLQAQLDTLQPALKVQVEVERQQAVRAAQDAGQRIATGLGQAFDVYNRRYGLNKSMQLLRGDVGHELRKLGPVGRTAMAQNVLDWAREQDRQNPKLRKETGKLTDAIVAQFKAMGQNITVVNGQILDGSTKQWQSISAALTTPVETAKEKVTKGFTAIQQQALGALTQMGFSRSESANLLKSSTSTRNTAASLITGNAGERAAAHVIANPQIPKSKKARGGRIPGMGLMDTVMVAPGQMAAPGELIVNRHTESRVNRLLGRFGTSLGGEVGRESRPHHAAFGDRVPVQVPTAANTGAGSMSGLHAGIAAGVKTVLAQFPGLSVTSTTGGTHAKGSYHYLGEAADIGGSPALMNKAAAWIGSNMGASLLEGIHNPNLSIRNGSVVPSSYWGASTWAQHANHIHMAIGDRSNAGTFAGLAGGGGGSVGSINLKAPSVGVGGVPGLVADKALQAVAAGLSAKVNAGLAGAGGTLGGPGGGGGTAGANQALGKSMMLAAGWGASQWPALKALWTRESGWNTEARNPSSGAFGIPQALGHGAIGNTAQQQIAWGLHYIRGRYGSPSGAWAHEQSAGWYGRGGRLPQWGGWHARGGRKTFNSPTLIGVGDNGTEDVTITPRRGGGAGASQVHLHVHPGAIVVQGAGRGASDVADEVMARLVRLIRGMGMEPEESIA